MIEVKDLEDLGFKYYEYGGGYDIYYHKDGVIIPVELDLIEPETGEKYIEKRLMTDFVRFEGELADSIEHLEKKFKIKSIEDLKEFYLKRTGKELFK